MTLKLDGVAPLMTDPPQISFTTFSIKKNIFEKIYIDMGNTKIGGKLRNPFFSHIFNIGRWHFLKKKGMPWLGSGFKIGLNENLSKFKDT